MSESDELEACLDYLQRIKGKGRSPARFEEIVASLQNVAATRGLDEVHIEVVLDVVKNNELRAGLSASLIRCLVPKKIISNSIIDDIIRHLKEQFEQTNNIPVTICSLILSWLAGLWEYQLVDKRSLNIYYDTFFNILLKKQRFESSAAKLIYILTKPEDITRRQVTRLLHLQSKYTKPPKHIIALLSLFKSYKPELVPEKIETINIESVWKGIPDDMRIGFENTKTRNSLDENNDNECFYWNLIRSTDESKKYQPLIASIRYFDIGSSKLKDQDKKKLFDLNNVDDIGRYQFNVELPTGSTSLLLNTAGYHFLTFASYEYQSRFSHNLYNILRGAFIVRPFKYSYKQKNLLLDMTMECCRYMQQGIPVVVRFLNEYLLYESGKYRRKLLRLMEWATTISVSDLEIVIGPYLKSIFMMSSLEDKCAIIKSLTALTENLYVNQKFGKTNLLRPSSFLGQEPTSELTELILALVKIVDDLITTGLNIHDSNIKLLAESISYYETFNCLNMRCKNPLIHLPPISVIYSGLVTKSCYTLSRTCGLLLQYRHIHNEIDKLGLRNKFVIEINNLYTFANDFGNALWYDKAFVDRHEGKFVPNLPDYIAKCLSPDLQNYLSIRNHLALLPHISKLVNFGLCITTNEMVLRVAQFYFPTVSQFLYMCSDLDE